MNNIKHISFENKTSWTTIRLIQTIVHIMESNEKFISNCRDTGCTFTLTDGVKAAIAPVSMDAPRDTLFFMFYEAKERKNGK